MSGKVSIGSDSGRAHLYLSFELFKPYSDIRLGKDNVRCYETSEIS